MSPRGPMRPVPSSSCCLSGQPAQLPSFVWTPSHYPGAINAQQAKCMIKPMILITSLKVSLSCHRCRLVPKTCVQPSVVTLLRCVRARLAHIVPELRVNDFVTSTLEIVWNEFLHPHPGRTTYFYLWPCTCESNDFSYPGIHGALVTYASWQGLPWASEHYWTKLEGCKNMRK